MARFQDVQYGDIDIMEKELDFTVSSDRFGGLPAYVKELKTRGIKFATILVRELAGMWVAVCSLILHLLIV
jgi:hypothetical protein